MALAAASAHRLPAGYWLAGTQRPVSWSDRITASALTGTGCWPSLLARPLLLHLLASIPHQCCCAASPFPGF